VVLAATFETIDLVEILVLLGVPVVLLALAIFYRPSRRPRPSGDEPDTR
jgi:hypothetical protein